LLAVAGLLVAIGLVDQGTKHWAWWHLPQTGINAGSTWFLGRPVYELFLGPTSGAVLDGLDAGLLLLALVVLLRRRQRWPVLASGALQIGGWGSNLLDRLGLHSVTAPGSARGAVDFIPIGRGVYCNLADVAILAGTVLALWTLRRRFPHLGAVLGRLATSLAAARHGRRIAPAALAVAVASAPRVAGAAGTPAVGAAGFVAVRPMPVAHGMPGAARA
jgi:lipoprotein signal peptidase